MTQYSISSLIAYPIHRHCLLAYLLLCLLCTSVSAQEVQSFSEQPLFVNGSAGYSCFRIPAMIKAGNGDLLAFAEGRRYSCNDFGDVDIVLKRSTDHGKTWSMLSVVADNAAMQAGNPAPLLDLKNPSFPQGQLMLLYNTGNNSEHAVRQGQGVREVWIKTSTDHGKTWSTARNITPQVHRPKQPDFNPAYTFPEDWRSYALTPGHAFQINKGNFSGRLIVPANHSAGEPQAGFNEYRTHVLYSDDHGANWALSENVEMPSSNEATGAQLQDGRVMLNIRQQNGEKRQRLIALSEDGGVHWSKVFFDSTLIGPVCQASLLNVQLPNGQEGLLFSNPASRDSRTNLTARLSIDDGQNWSFARSIRLGTSAYSDLVQTEQQEIGCLYEHGNSGSIFYAQFNFEWLLGDVAPEAQALSTKLLENGGATTFALAPPRLEFGQTFIIKPEKVKAVLDLPGSEIRYTRDGRDPGKEDPLMPDYLSIQDNAELSVRAFHPDFLPSPVVRATFYKAPPRVKIKKATLAKGPSERYAGSGAAGLVDYIKGPKNFHDRAWMGFNGDDVDCTIALKRSQTLKKVTISVLADQGSWILPPQSIQVFASKDGKEYKELGMRSFPMTKASASGGQQYLDLELLPQKAKFIRVLVKNQLLPDWHPGKGTPAWIFIDEIIFE